mmetsp:Transcript_43837/g.102371  ORF Transcript_43837/g.102371 Transcript_43837/m.102371 type:complete len:854 (-) Transcript_43837:64-2625(-)
MSAEQDDAYDPWFDQITLGIDEPPAEPASGKKVAIKHPDGSMLDVDQMNVSDNLKQLIRSIDADDDGVVDEVNVRDALQMFTTMKSIFGSNGHMSHAEVEKGLNLLHHLVKERDANSGEVTYTHMPEGVQDVMKEWDMDRSGTVSVVELSAAAKAHKKIREEGYLMKRIIVGLVFVILILLTGTFVLSYMAVDLAKEMRGTGSGVMETPDGEVVKVASSAFDVQEDGTLVTRNAVTPSCPGNSTCRRLQSSAPVLQTAQSKPGKQLASTLPDDVFKNLDMVTLSAEPHFLQLKVTSMKRVQMRSSKCGSVVELHTQEGVLTIDDTTLTADANLATYMEEAGMMSLLESGGLFGRRLSAGFLEGFFTLLEDMEWECTSVALPSPEDIPPAYHAKTRVTELMAEPVYSAFLPGELLPGISHENGKFYRSWTEDALVLPSMQVAKKSYQMHPLQAQLDVTMGGGRATLNQMGTAGHRCLLGSAPLAEDLASLVSQASGLRLVRLIQEHGKVLRQWNMQVGDVMSTDNISSLAGLMGFLGPDITLEYYDVDTDPTGAFESGRPYRIHAFAENGQYDVKVQYLEMSAVDADMTLSGALGYFGVEALASPCQIEPHVQSAANVALKDELEKLGVVAGPKVPKIEPWTEWPAVVKFNCDRFKEIYAGQLPFQIPLPDYWKKLLFNTEHQELLAELADLPVPTSGSDVTTILIHGLNTTIQVEYSNSSNSLVGGLASVHVTIDGDFFLSSANAKAAGIHMEVEITQDAPERSCTTKELTGSTGMSGELTSSMFMTTCLMEEFDYISLRSTSYAGGISPTGAFAQFSKSRKMAAVDVTTKTRPLCSPELCSSGSPGATREIR